MAVQCPSVCDRKCPHRKKRKEQIVSEYNASSRYRSNKFQNAPTDRQV